MSGPGSGSVTEDELLRICMRAACAETSFEDLFMRGGFFFLFFLYIRVRHRRKWGRARWQICRSGLPHPPPTSPLVGFHMFSESSVTSLTWKQIRSVIWEASRTLIGASGSFSLNIGSARTGWWTVFGILNANTGINHPASFCKCQDVPSSASPARDVTSYKPPRSLSRLVRSERCGGEGGDVGRFGSPYVR